MKQLIERIKEIDAQMQKIKRILSDGNYAASGIELTISLGPLFQYDDDDHHHNVVKGISLGVSSDQTPLLNMIYSALWESRKFNQTQLTREVESARLFLDTTPVPPKLG